MNFNESISKITYDNNYEDDDVLHFELAGYRVLFLLSPAIICSNKGRKNNIRIIGAVWELKKNNYFGKCWKE